MNDRKKVKEAKKCSRGKFPGCRLWFDYSVAALSTDGLQRFDPCSLTALEIADEAEDGMPLPIRPAHDLAGTDAIRPLHHFDYVRLLAGDRHYRMLLPVHAGLRRAEFAHCDAASLL
jgi:hypothetical protein